MGDEKLSWNQRIHFIENSGKVPINLFKSVSGAFTTLAWDLLHIFRKKNNLKGHCQALFIAFLYFLISIVCKVLLRAEKCNSALLHLADNEFFFLSHALSRNRGVSWALAGWGRWVGCPSHRAKGAPAMLQRPPTAGQSDFCTGSCCDGFAGGGWWILSHCT